MAKIKSEYLVHYYRHNGLPLFNRMMGLLPILNAWLYRLAPVLTPLLNWALQTSLTKSILAQIGIHPARSLPRYAPETFATWFHRASRNKNITRPPARETSNPVSSADYPNGPVLLFHDTWVNFNEIEIGKAVVRVLEAAGYQVYLTEGRQCCGRPLITGGQADKARPWIDHNVALLAPYATQGIPIIGVEPSCILTLRDESITLASDSHRAQIVAGAVYTFDEFIEKEIEASRFHPGWRQHQRKAYLHGHCHQKALVGNDASLTVLRAAGFMTSLIPSGCCGMAGDFGYVTDHYEVSRRIGEDRLFPAVRAAEPDAFVVASGTSCRHQIEHFTGRPTVHMAQALAAVLDIE